MRSWKRIKWVVLTALVLAAMVALVGCGGSDNNAEQQNQAGESAKLSGDIKIDGSSTVFPITEAVAEEFQKLHRDVRVTVGVSGTGGGFKKFYAGETDISDASRPIKDKEKAKCEEAGIKFTQVPVAFDGITVVVNKNNKFIDKLTVEELKKIWEPGSSVTKWSDVREGWPNEKIELYGPGTDSGTFDYFTDAINGEEGASRPDYTASEDDNVLVQGVAGDDYSLGYFGYAYYAENTDKLKAVPVVNSKGEAVEPNMETINSGTYEPLSRPIFIYVKHAALEKPEVSEFVKYYLTEGPALIPDVGYVPLPEDEYQDSLSNLGL